MVLDRHWQNWLIDYIDQSIVYRKQLRREAIHDDSGGWSDLRPSQVYTLILPIYCALQVSKVIWRQDASLPRDVPVAGGLWTAFCPRRRRTSRQDQQAVQGTSDKIWSPLSAPSRGDQHQRCVDGGLVRLRTQIRKKSWDSRTDAVWRGSLTEARHSASSSAEHSEQML